MDAKEAIFAFVIISALMIAAACSILPVQERGKKKSEREEALKAAESFVRE